MTRRNRNDTSQMPSPGTRIRLGTQEYLVDANGSWVRQTRRPTKKGDRPWRAA